MKWSNYIKIYNENENPASTIFHKYISKNLAKIIVFFSLKLGFSANVISTLSFIMILIASLSLIQFNNIIVFIIATQLSYGFDCADGVVARINKNGSSFGKFFDLLLDRLNQLIFFVSTIFYFIVNFEVNFFSITIILFSVSLYFMYSISAMLRGLVFKTRRGKGIENQNIFSFIVKIIYEFIDTGIFMLIISVSLIFNVYFEIIIFYGIISFFLIIGVIYKAYSEK